MGRLGVPLVLLAASALLGACGRGDGGASEADLARLERAAQDAGTAVDIWTATHGDLGLYPPVRFTARLWTGSGLEPAAGTRVVRYRPGITDLVGRTGTMAAREDRWQLCVVGSDGAWVTYGSTSGVQQRGRTGRACRFSGDHDPRAGFDHRLWVQSAYDALTADDPAKEAVGYRFPTELGAATRSDLGLALPSGWRVPRFAQPDYTRVQLCLVGPDGHWFRTADDSIVATGAGRCRLDPGFHGTPEYLMGTGDGPS